MIEFLLVVVIVISIILLSLLIFIWVQLNSTNSRLVILIEDRIRLNNINYKLDIVENLIAEEEPIDLKNKKSD